MVTVPLVFRKNKAVSHSKGLTVTAYRGDNSVLLGFDLEEKQTKNLAGFAIALQLPNGKTIWIKNRLNFHKPLHSGSSTVERLHNWTDSNSAPIQRFRWQHFPMEIVPGSYIYSVTAMYFNRQGGLEEGASSKVSVEFLPKESFDQLEIGFTRSYVSSQAYHDLFGNEPIRPLPKTLDYDTSDYQKKYRWLGSTAHQLVFDFLNQALEDPEITVDALIYDVDEVDFVQGLEQLGSRLRLFFDDSKEHMKKTALESTVHKRIEVSAGKENVRYGHFKRFQHNKILIQKKNNIPIRVLTGSLNFSVRGFYVQANNILIFENERVASLYASVFQKIWEDEAGFSKSELAQDWFAINESNLPSLEICFSPHRSSEISLSKIEQALDGADSSVFFSVMDLEGGGGVLQRLQSMAMEREDIFSYGVTQRLKKTTEEQDGIRSYGPGSLNGVLVPFAFLRDQVRYPFSEEISGGAGQVIHNKFIVIDFNADNPIVFTGSSNIASGGEISNGDNLLAIYDPEIAILYAVEACRLVDHFRFRAALQKATASEPLVLKRDELWWQSYYDPADIHFKERNLFCQ